MPKQKVSHLFARGKDGLTLFPGIVADLALPMNFDRDGCDKPEQSTAFGQPSARAEALVDVEENKETGKIAGVRCYVLNHNPHCNTTHTENIGHLHQTLTTMAETAEGLDAKYLRAALITVVPVKCTEEMLSLHPYAKVDDLIITRESIEFALKRLSKIFSKHINALIVRCDHEAFLDRPFHTFKNPPYFSTQAMDYIVDEFCDVGQGIVNAKKVNIQHLLSNLPSIDPESDEGTLLCHTRFFGATDDRKGYLSHTENGRAIQPKKRTNTEMLHLTKSQPDGCYFLQLNIPKTNLDHAMSQPRLFDVRSIHTPYDELKNNAEQSPNLSVRRPC
jgi:arylformamidase